MNKKRNKWLASWARYWIVVLWNLLISVSLMINSIELTIPDRFCREMHRLALTLCRSANFVSYNFQYRLNHPCQWAAPEPNLSKYKNKGRFKNVILELFNSMLKADHTVGSNTNFPRFIIELSISTPKTSPNPWVSSTGTTSRNGASFQNAFNLAKMSLQTILAGKKIQFD